MCEINPHQVQYQTDNVHHKFVWTAGVMASLQMVSKTCFTRKAASISSTYIVVFDNKKHFLNILQGTDYPKLGFCLLVLCMRI